MSKFKVAIIFNEAISLGPKQEAILYAISHNPNSGTVMAFDKDSLRRLQEREILNVHNQLTDKGKEFLKKLKSKEIESFPSWAAAMHRTKSLNKDLRKERDDSPCGCSCKSCVKRCTGQGLNTWGVIVNKFDLDIKGRENVFKKDIRKYFELYQRPERQPEEENKLELPDDL